MNNLTGLSSNAPSYPSFPLKEQLLNVLESKEIDLNALLKLLEVELKASEHLKTVHEVVNYYEEENGQLSLQTWESIFQGLGYSEDFLRVLAHFNEQRRCQGPAELAMASLETSTEKKNDESGASSTDYVSPKDTKTEKGGVHHYQHLVVMAGELSNQLATVVNELDNSALDTAAAAVKVTEGPLSPPVTQMSSSREQPSLGLPICSPEDTCMDSEDHLTNFSSQSSTRAAGAEADDSGFFSVLNSDDSVMLSGDNDASSSSSSSLNSIIKTAECSTSSQTGAPMVCHERPVSEAIAPAALQTSEPLSISSQSFATSVANQSNEMVDSQSQSFDSICSETDQQQNETSETEDGSDVGFSMTSGPSIPNHWSEASSRMAATFNTATGFPPAGHCNGTKNYDASGNVSLVEELQKKIEELHANVIFRVERLQNQMLICQHVQDRNSRLQQGLLECRSRCTRLEEQMEEFTGFLNQSAELEAESQRLIRMTQEWADSKEEEYNRLQERRRIENESQAVRMSNLERKNEELQSHLVEMGIAMTDKNETIRTQQEECNRLRERQREDFERNHLQELQEMRRRVFALEEENEKLKKEVVEKQTMIDGIMDVVRQPSILDAAPASVACDKPACDRIKYDDTDVMLMKEALLVASRAEISAESKDFPSVGCVIRRSGHPFLRELYSIGWNGFLLKTSESDLASIKPKGGGPFKSLNHKGRVLAHKRGLHAEEKALHACGEQNLSDATVYLTHVPCHDCAKRLLERNIRRVFYLFWMDKSNDTIELFKNHEKGKTCVAFPQRDLILDDFRSDFLTKYSITSGSTEPEKPPMECPSFVHPRDYKRE